jgi:radical SAM enzyme (TIGR01210 family)
MEQLTKEINQTTNSLRNKYYRYGNVQQKIDTTPFGGSIRESIGPFPEFILKGRFCARSLKGYCSPCFYSRLPEHDITESGYDKGYETQVDYIINNFDTLVENNQVGRVAFPERFDHPIYGMVCTPTGSYFDNTEYPVGVRKVNLRKILNAADQRNAVVALHIESHAEDVVSYFDNPDVEELELLHKLNARIILGFESINELARNVVYAKNLAIEDFNAAVNILRVNKFAVGAFVFAGLFSYTDGETIADVNDSLRFLKENQISPVLMFANTQKYTIPDVLLQNKKFKLLDAHTVLEIVNNMVDIFGNDMSGAIDPWFVADPKGGPPDPNNHIFNADENTACPQCSNAIYDAIERLRISKDIVRFKSDRTEIAKCSCSEKYAQLLETQKICSISSNLPSRIDNLIDYTKSNLERYVLMENSWVVKAELLCLGLYLTEEQKKIAADSNPYVCEKGLIHALHIKYKSTTINICVAEKFCETSPYHARYEGNDIWSLLKTDVNGQELDLGEFIFVKLPKWTRQQLNDSTIGALVRPHSDKCLSLWPSLDCSYIKRSEGCRFCGLLSEQQAAKKCLPVDQVVDAVKAALDYNPDYEVNLSGGTCGSPDTALHYLVDICRGIKRSCGDIYISVECAPPSDDVKLHELKDAGATAVIMNLEIYDEQLRREICPGKSAISRDRYFESLSTAVELFGHGNVSSVIIVGLQPKADVLKACRQLIDIGVVPTLMPFKPLDGTPLENCPLPNPEEYIDVSKQSALLMKKRSLGIKCNSGCASCGACSLEIDLSEVFE